MFTPTDLVSSLQNFKLAQTLITALRETKDWSKVASITIELQEAVMAAQDKYATLREQHSALSEEHALLKREMAEIKSNVAELEHYKPVELAPGQIVLGRTPESEPAGPFHYLCPNCATKKKVSLLTPEHSNTSVTYKCPNGCPSTKIRKSVVYSTPNTHHFI